MSSVNKKEVAKEDDTFQVDEPVTEAVEADEQTRNYIHYLFPDAGDPIDSEMIDKLSEGLLSRYRPTLSKTKAELQELTENQRIQIETLLQENAKFSESEDLKEVKATMEKGKLYHEKLTKVKKEMLQLHDKSAKLKKRAIALQQQRQKQDLLEEQQREQQAARERQLIAKPAAQKPVAAATAKPL